MESSGEDRSSDCDCDIGAADANEQEPFGLEENAGLEDDPEALEMLALGLPVFFTAKVSKKKRGQSPNMEEGTSPEDLSNEVVRSKKKKKKKKRKIQCTIDDEIVLPEGFNVELAKYWCQRYSFFSNFDKGILMDEEGWFSVTPEVIAQHHAERCASHVIVDAFTGVGGNAIQFALRCEHVIAIDKDPTKIAYARHNAEIYGVSDRIEFITGDFFLLAPRLKADAIFLSPPWGGPEYCRAESYDMQTMLQPKDGLTLLKAAQAIAPNVALYLPRNVNLEQVEELSGLLTPPLKHEVEENFVNKKLKAITVYYGNFVS